MTKRDGYVIAVVGAASLVGREIAQELRQREFPLADLRRLGSADELADLESEPGSSVGLLDGADFTGVDVAFTCGDETQSAEWIPRIVESGTIVIDTTQVLGEREEIPVVVPEVNAAFLADPAARKVVTTPVAGATALSVVLGPLERLAGLRYVVATACEAVSGDGEPGVRELAHQSGELLSGAHVERDRFPARIAFNVIPRVGPMLAEGRARSEKLIGDQLRRILDLPDLGLSVTAMWIPVFFGNSYSLHVELSEPTSRETVEETLRTAPGILLRDHGDEGETLSTSDVVGGSAAIVGRVRCDPSYPDRLDLWLCLDGLRKGTATNAVQIAEILARDYL